MIILNNMYTGRYITQQGMLGHEAINLTRADNGNFYIWLNSMGICKVPGANGCTILMVRTINASLYKVLAKAENCMLCDGADIPRKKGNAGIDDKKERATKQRKLGVTYNQKDPMTHIFNEEDMFATFWTPNVYEVKEDIYITNKKEMEYLDNHYFADFKISEAMRAYIDETNSASEKLKEVINADIWKPITQENVTNVAMPEFNFFKLIRKDKDELSFSNALAYFIEKAGIKNFLQNALNLEQSYLNDDYTLLREKNNIDISFFGEKNVVIIENKIDAYITADNRKTIDSQIKKAVDEYCTGKESEKTEMENQIKAFVSSLEGDSSQLSKYYFYAVAYLLNKGMDIADVSNHIKCFLLIPEYAKKQFKQNSDGCFESNFMLSDVYKIITYKDISSFFSERTVEDKYLEDFLSALVPLKNEFNNDLEKEMKYRFLKAIGKL